MSTTTVAVDHTVFVARDPATVPSRVKVTGKVWKQDRFGRSYQHTQITWVDEGSDFTGKRVSHSRGEIKQEYACSCGRVAFHAGWDK